jgi:hypothetical protein
MNRNFEFRSGRKPVLINSKTTWHAVQIVFKLLKQSLFAPKMFVKVQYDVYLCKICVRGVIRRTLQGLKRKDNILFSQKQQQTDRLKTLAG